MLICAASDTALILAGVGGLGAVISALPWLLIVMRWAGVAYLTWFGVRTGISVVRGEHLDSQGKINTLTMAKAVTTTLMLTFLNPHVYLDTVIFAGSLANQFGDNRWWFAAGSATASWLWFSSIGFGARWASPLLARPVFWKVLDTIIALMMFGLAGVLAFAKL